MKLDLGCGTHRREGHVGVDIVSLPEVEYVVDLLDFPWPWAAETIEGVWCAHFFEHVPGPQRGQWMDELYRILVPGAIATIIVPEWNTRGAVQDFTHQWPPVCEESFLYFNAESRRLMGIEHYPVMCNFLLQPSRLTDPIPQLQMRLKKA
jgi:hypothetical protein